MSKVIVHSPGMISVDASEIKPTTGALAFLQNSNLYHKLSEQFGAEQAREIIESSIPDRRAEPNPIASRVK